MHDGTANDEVFAELIFEVCAEERLALHGESGLVFKFNIHIGTRFENRSIEDGDRSHGVVHGVVHILDECSTAGCDGDRTAWHIHRTKAYLAAVRSFVFTGEVEFILLAQLLCNDESGVVEFLEAVFIDQSWVIT